MKHNAESACVLFRQVTRVDGTVKTTDTSGNTYLESELPSELETYYDHYSECYNRCMLLESSLTSLETATGYVFFPAIIGRRPASAANEAGASPLQGKENMNNPPVVGFMFYVQFKFGNIFIYLHSPLGCKNWHLKSTF